MKSFVHGEINEFVQWYDTDGNIINASDGALPNQGIFDYGYYRIDRRFQVCALPCLKGEAIGSLILGSQ